MADDQDDQQTTEDQSTMEPAGNDQPADQSDEQATGQADETGLEAESQSTTESDQPTEQPIQVAEAGGEQAGEGDGGATDGVARDAVAAAGGAGTTKTGTRNLKVVAEFTEDGEKFIGDILIHIFESDNGQQGRLLFPTTGQFWQTVLKGNVITTPVLRVSTSEILVFAHARALLPGGDYQTMDTQDNRIPLPSGDTLQLKFDVGVGEVDMKINAPDANAAIAKALQSPQLKGHLVKGDLKAESAGNQQFRVTGKFLSGDITLL